MIAMFKRIILFIIRIFRQALCCFSRKRVDSESLDRLEVVNVISDSPNYNKSKNVVNLYENFQLKNELKLKFLA